MPWYIVMTKPRAEWAVHTELRRLGYDTLYLHRRETISHARRKIAVIRPLYARYLFVAVAPGQAFPRRDEPYGVSTILRGPSGPREIPETEIEQERTRCDETGLVAPPAPIVRALIPPGTEVVITQGVWSQFPGIVTLDDGKEITVSMNLFGRDTPAVVPAAWVRPVSPKVGSLPEIGPIPARQRR